MRVQKWKLLYIISSFLFGFQSVYAQSNLKWDIRVEKESKDVYTVLYIVKIADTFGVPAIEEEMVGLNYEDVKSSNISKLGKLNDNYNFSNRAPNGVFVNYYKDSLILSQRVELEKRYSHENVKLLTKISCIPMPLNDELVEPPEISFHFVIIWNEIYPTVYVGYDNLQVHHFKD